MTVLSGKKIYLDYNIVSYIVDPIEEGVERIFPDNIAEFISKNSDVVYSPAHMEELCVPYLSGSRGLEDVSDKLLKISNLTEDLSIGPGFRRGMRVVSRMGPFGAHFHHESTLVCFERVYLHRGLNKSAEKGQEDFSNRAADTDVSSVVVNNVDPMSLFGNDGAAQAVMSEYKEILEAGSVVNVKFNIACAEFINEEIRRTLAEGPESPRESFPLIANFHAAVMAMIEAAMKFLTISRFYPEPVAKSRSDMHDITHAIYGAYCDYFVTNDRRFFRKCVAVFEYLGVPCRVMMMSDFIKFCKSEMIGDGVVSS